MKNNSEKTIDELKVINEELVKQLKQLKEEVEMLNEDKIVIVENIDSLKNYIVDTRNRLAFIIPIGTIVGTVCGIMMVIPNVFVSLIGAIGLFVFLILSFIKSIGFFK